MSFVLLKNTPVNLPEMDVGDVSGGAEKDDPHQLSENHQPQLGRVESLEQKMFRLVERETPVQPAGPHRRCRLRDQVAPALGRGDDDFFGRPAHGHSGAPVFERPPVAVFPFGRLLRPERDRKRGRIVLKNNTII